jgi:hypothetical protein
MNLIRRARAALTVGVLWGVVWGVGGAAFMAWRVLFGAPRLVMPLRYLMRFTLSGGIAFGLCGLATGTAFAIALSIAEQRRSAAGLSRWRATALGAAAGVAAASLFVVTVGAPFRLLLVADLFMGSVGAFSAATTVFLAQRAPDRARIESSDIEAGV